MSQYIWNIMEVFLTAVFYGIAYLVFVDAASSDPKGTVKTYPNPCGTIGYYYPITKTRPARVIFTPEVQYNNTEVTWHIPDPVSNSTEGVDMYTDGETYHLRLNNSLFLDKTRILIHAEYGDCTSRQRHFPVTDLGDCGLLDLRPHDLIAGQDAHLVYFPPSTILTTLTNASAVTWMTNPSVCDTSTCDGVVVNVSEAGHVTMTSERAEFELTLHAVDPSMDGEYYVRCESGAETNNVTINVIVPESPTPPIISPLITIHGAQYIVGRAGEPLNVTCNTTGGTEPVTVTLRLGGEALETEEDGITRSRYKVLTGGHHMAEVTCEVDNIAPETPLVARAKVYMIQNPSFPTLVVNEAEEFKPTNISCTVTNVRPAPNITFSVGRELVTGVMDDIYSGTARLDSLYRRWNGKYVFCCVHNDLYKPIEKCSRKKRLSYKFRWETLGLKLPRVDHIRPYYVIDITCIVGNANPKCEPIWTYMRKEHLVLDESKVHDTRTPDGGVTSKKTLTLNVTSEYNGEIFKCHPDCSLFEPSPIVYEIRVPALPEAHINLSTNASSVEVLLGDSLVLECSGTGMPLSEVSWKYAGNVTDVNVTSCGSRSECLGIESAGSSHNGSYTCTAQNKFGMASRTIQLRVTYPEGGYEDLELPFLSNLLLILLVGFVLLFLLILGAVLGVLFKTRKRTSNSTNLVARGIRHHSDEATSLTKKEKPTHNVTFEAVDDTLDSDPVEVNERLEAGRKVYQGFDETLPEKSAALSTRSACSTFVSEPSDAMGRVDVGIIGDGASEMNQRAGDVDEGGNALLSMDDIQKIAPLSTDSFIEQCSDAISTEPTPCSEIHGMASQSGDTVTIQF